MLDLIMGDYSSIHKLYNTHFSFLANLKTTIFLF
nr:MAG TPA: hypothetical protein [Siphoviridae sp. ctEdl3]